MKNIVILISGRGSNMQAVVEAAIPNVNIRAVISNNEHAAGLAWAASRGIATAALNHKNYPDRAAFDAALAAETDRHAPDLVVLAGFMRILTPEFCRRYAGRLINIHPSLLPAFPGLDTHQPPSLTAAPSSRRASSPFSTTTPPIPSPHASSPPNTSCCRRPSPTSPQAVCKPAATACATVEPPTRKHGCCCKTPIRKGRLKKRNPLLAAPKLRFQTACFPSSPCRIF